MKFLLLFFLSLLFTAQEAFSQLQIYPNQLRPNNQNWQVLSTDHFRIIYPVLKKDAAYRTASILESEYDDISDLTGGELNNFRVIINSENDRSNGFVDPLNFRSEIELAPIKGKNMNPRSGDWLETVVPHELVHALHFNSKTPSLTNITGLFSPDIRRSIHSAAPFGILEGIAVEYESHNQITGAGRGNYPFFTNQFQSLLGSNNEWSMGQLVQRSDFSFPFDRHYNGGYHFTNWLLESEGEDVIRESIKYHYRWPFLGFGFALRKKTGEYPSSLYQKFNSEMNQKEQVRRSSVQNETDSESILFENPDKGLQSRRPLYLDETRIIYYQRSYHSPSGFYVYDLNKKKSSLLKEVVIVEDFKFSYDQKGKNIYFARYKTDRHFDNTFRSDLFRLDIESGKVKSLTNKRRIFSPEVFNNSLYALQTDNYENKPVLLDKKSGSILSETTLPAGYSVQEITIHSAIPELAAVLAKKAGVQGIWVVNTEEIESFYKKNPTIVFDSGSVFDPVWHSSERNLLFSSDDTGVMNIYEYDQNQTSVIQITNSLFNAMEASYSPSGDKIVYIRQIRNEMHPAILKKKNYFNKSIAPGNWQSSDLTEARMKRPLMNRSEIPDSTNWTSESYHTGMGWLKPRLWTPVIKNNGDATQTGLRFYSTDDLAKNSYSMEVTHAQNRLWYELSYQYSGIFPGFRLSLQSEPQFPSFRMDGENGEDQIFSFMLENREFEFSLPFRFLLERNARFSSLTIRPKYEFTQLKFFQINSASLSDFSNIHSAGLSVIFNYRLRQFIRNIQPNAGWIFYAQSEVDLNGSDFTFKSSNLDFQGRFSDRKGLRGGIFTFTSLKKNSNQSLRLGFEFLTQSELPQFNNQDLVSDSFSGLVFNESNKMSFLSARYTIPLIHPDTGGFLLPLYLSNIYLVLFSQTVNDLSRDSFSLISDRSRTIIGTGIRSRFRLSNLSIDIGFSFGFEPSRNDYTFMFGTF